jgi:hypothetical protein
MVGEMDDRKIVVTVEQKNYVMPAINVLFCQLLCFFGTIMGMVYLIDAYTNKQHCGGKTPPGYGALAVVTFVPPIVALLIVLF